MDGAEAPEGFDDWEQLQSLNTQFPSSPSQSTEWERLVIREDYLFSDCSAFPPSQHEGLGVPSENFQAPEQLISPSPAAAASDLLSASGGGRRGEIMRSFLRLHLELLSSRVHRMASAVRYYAAGREGRWSVGMAAAGAAAALLLTLLCSKVRRRRRRRLQREAWDRLMLLVREKDEKISQLMLQVAQMSEILSARRKVPVFRLN
ncbi:uncharacterized protein LOC131143746 [Malania oleifera]|uniref:uncharacterized protein LOC131143746 n=1 Tax=Malania oleifera TaxID=397392 RepID=UPI0025AD9EE1|nr:uncharacterized protein LOC131143746 [Malania oleifera]